MCCSNNDDLFDDDYIPPQSGGKGFDHEFKDEFRDDEEYTSVERTSTTTTEKIRRGRKSRSSGRDMGPYKDDDSKVTGNQSNVINEEMGLEGQGRRDVWRFDSLQHLAILVQRECDSLYGMNVTKY